MVTLQFFFSSPNVDIFQVRPSSMSLKFIKNRTLPSTEPWRTPHFTLNQGDGAPFRTTFCFPSKMVKFSIQLWILQVTPYEGSSLGNSCWGTFSNDFWKLWYITYAGFSSIYYLKKINERSRLSWLGTNVYSGNHVLNYLSTCYLQDISPHCLELQFQLICKQMTLD